MRLRRAYRSELSKAIWSAWSFARRWSKIAHRGTPPADQKGPSASARTKNRAFCETDWKIQIPEYLKPAKCCRINNRIRKIHVT